MTPQVGKIVHLTMQGQPCYAAIITQVNPDETVALEVFWPPYTEHWQASSLGGVSQDENHSHKHLTWHSPECEI